MNTTEKRTRLLKISGALEVFWGSIEILFMFLTIAWGLNAIANPYPEFIWSVTREIMGGRPWLVVLIMAMMGSMRIIGGLGLIKNREYGVWLTLVISMMTLNGMSLFAPPAVIDSLVCTIVVILMLLGRFGTESAVE